MTKPKSKVVRMLAQDLRIHPLAQRDVLPSTERRLMATLDLDAIGVLHAVQYDVPGHGCATWVIDGQHRQRVLLAHGLGEWPVDVKIHLGVTDDAHASALFLKLNDRSSVSPFDKFKNEVIAGDETACGVLKQLRSRGIRVAKEPGDARVRCVMAAKRVYGFDGGIALGCTLDTVVAAWGKTEAALDGKLIEGIGVLYRTYDEAIDQPALAKRLAKFPGGASGLLGRARGFKEVRGGTVPHCVAQVLVDLYNAGRRSGKLDPL
jgi:hypothetical protein